MILVTGSEGLIGKLLVKKLKTLGLGVRAFDLKRSAAEDVCNAVALEHAMKDVKGVIHLAAVSRVAWAENDTELCRQTNILAIEDLARFCLDSQEAPWLILASSREVYGQASQFPVHEDVTPRPMNIYARSKMRGEQIVRQVRESGLVANICRFSNVYGAVHDHEDRVVNAFARVAAFGGTIRLEGPTNTFDFTFVDEVVEGLAELVCATNTGERHPPIHFVSGQPTTLEDLAQVTLNHAHAKVVVKEEAPRSFDVSSFVGDPERAKSLLGWQARTGIEAGISALLDRHKAARAVRVSAS